MSWRNTRDYRIWRARVIRRDKTCKICSTRQNRQAHHLNNGSYFSKERFNTENGITLCQECHSIFHNKYKNNTREKCTKEDFIRYNKIITHFIERSIEYTLTRLKKENNLINF